MQKSFDQLPKGAAFWMFGLPAYKVSENVARMIRSRRIVTVPSSMQITVAAQ